MYLSKHTIKLGLGLHCMCFRGTDLSYLDLSGLNLESVDFTRANLTHANLKQLIKCPLKSTAVVATKDVRLAGLDSSATHVVHVIATEDVRTSRAHFLTAGIFYVFPTKNVGGS